MPTHQPQSAQECVSGVHTSSECDITCPSGPVMPRQRSFFCSWNTNKFIPVKTYLHQLKPGVTKQWNWAWTLFSRNSQMTKWKGVSLFVVLKSLSAMSLEDVTFWKEAAVYLQDICEPHLNHSSGSLQGVRPENCSPVLKSFFLHPSFKGALWWWKLWMLEELWLWHYHTIVWHYYDTMTLPYVLGL